MDICIRLGFRYLRPHCVSAQAAMWMNKTGRDPDGAAVALPGAVVVPPALGNKGRRAGGRPDGHRRRHDVAGRALAVRPGSEEPSRAVDRGLSRQPLRRRSAGACPQRRAGGVRRPRPRARQPICRRLRTALCNSRAAEPDDCGFVRPTPFPGTECRARRATQAVRSRRRSRNRPQHRQRLAGKDTAHRGVTRWTPVRRGGHRRLVAGSS